MKIISGVYWDKGKRENNQDSLIFEQVKTNRGRVALAAVSDGIGGLSEGEIASGFIMEKLYKHFYEEILVLLDKKKGTPALKRSFLRCFFEINETLNKYAKSKEIKLGATISLLLIWGNKYMVVHLGDSRIWKLKRKKIKQITNDHKGTRNVLTKCMGSFAYMVPDITGGRVFGKTAFLLSTDGFYHYTDRNMLSELLNPGETDEQEQIEKRLKQLAAYGQKNGEQDNISAVYLLCK